MTAIVDDLKMATELIGMAMELVHAAASETFLASPAARLSVGEEVRRMRLHLMGLRGDLTMLHGTANRTRRRARDAGA